MSRAPTGILPGTRFAVDAYVAFVRDRTMLEAIASSLTEMFSPGIIAERVSGMLRNYDWVSQDTLAYFTPRLTQAPKDVDFALAYIYEHASTRAICRRACWLRIALQVRRAVVAVGRAALRLCRAGTHPAGGLCALRVMDSVPAFNRGFRLRHDQVRGSWVVLAPERLFLLDEPAVEVLKLVDGARSPCRPSWTSWPSSMTPRAS